MLTLARAEGAESMIETGVLGDHDDDVLDRRRRRYPIDGLVRIGSSAVRCKRTQRSGSHASPQAELSRARPVFTSSHIRSPQSEIVAGGT
jgi:hypothetical protein